MKLYYTNGNFQHYDFCYDQAGQCSQQVRTKEAAKRLELFLVLKRSIDSLTVRFSLLRRLVVPATPRTLHRKVKKESKQTLVALLKKTESELTHLSLLSFPNQRSVPIGPVKWPMVKHLLWPIICQNFMIGTSHLSSRRMGYYARRGRSSRRGLN